MISVAIINRIEGDIIYLMHIKDYGKKEATERSFWRIKNLEFKGDNPENFNLKIGNAVEYYIPEWKTIMASFTMLILPLIVFLVTFGVLKKIGMESEKLIALISIVATFGAFYIHKLLEKLGVKEILPVIVSLLEKEDLRLKQEECKECGSCTICD